MNGARNLVKLVVCWMIVASASLAQAMEVNINFALGVKALEEDDWGRAATGFDSENQQTLGVETTFGNPSWPVAIALDGLLSTHLDDALVTSPVPASIELTQETFEFDFGVRKIWKAGRARPFVGGGFGLISARQEKLAGVGLLTLTDDGSTVGVWFNGGAFWRLGKKFNIGVDLRLSVGEVSLFDRDVQAGGATLGLLLGWGWGGGGA